MAGKKKPIIRRFSNCKIVSLEDLETSRSTVGRTKDNKHTITMDTQSYKFGDTASIEYLHVIEDTLTRRSKRTKLACTQPTPPS